MPKSIPAIATALAVFASAAQGADSPKADSNPDWRHKPTPGDLLAVWPKEALRKGVSGQAEIECKVSLEGALFDCTALSESPAGLGFGAAAVALTPQFLMKPAIRNGQPVVVTIKMPIMFKNDGSFRPVDAAGSRTVVQNLAWLEAPAYADAKAAYPAKARSAGLVGHVTLQCDIRADGRLGPCDTVTEVPRGAGFAGAAKGLARRFVAPTMLADGQSTRNMSVSLPITFTAEMMSETPRLGKAVWAHLPAAADMDDAFPKAPGVSSVQVVLDCRVIVGGKLDDCHVESETPAGLGFGAAATGLASRFAVSIWTPEGLPTIGGRVRVPIRYQLK